MELPIKEKLVLKDSECYDWAGELPELKTGDPRECLVYHLAVYVVRKPSRTVSYTHLDVYKRQI